MLRATEVVQQLKGAPVQERADDRPRTPQEAREHLLMAYFGQSPDASLQHRFAATILAARLRESLWGRVQELHGRLEFDYRGYAEQHAEKFERNYVEFGGGENRSAGDRTGVNITYCLGWLRQEENQYLSCPPEIARTLDKKLQALIGYALVIVIGGIVGTAVARIPVLRAGIGALITGMQTLPSVLWYPLAVMVFGVTWKAIILMMVLGAAPSVANGFISGIDQVPPGLLRAGRILGARGVSLERHVVLPAAFPSILGGLKQGWAFAWHALLAGEFLILVNPLSLGGRTVGAETQGTYGVVVAMMIVIVFIGIMVDVAFSRVNGSVRRRYGLIDASAS